MLVVPVSTQQERLLIRPGMTLSEFTALVPFRANTWIPPPSSPSRTLPGHRRQSLISHPISSDVCAKGHDKATQQLLLDRNSHRDSTTL